MRKLIIPLSLLLVSLELATPSFAEKRPIKINIEPYITTGSSYFNEEDPVSKNNIGKGGKFTSSAGVNIHLEKEGSNLKGRFYGEIGSMTEPIDENHDHPNKEHKFGGEISYSLYPQNKINILPYAGIGYKRLMRDNNGDSNMLQEKRWDSLEFLEASAGIGLHGNLGYMMAGAILPLRINANKGANPKADFGFNVEIGTKWKRFRFGLGYEETKFKESLNGETPGFTRAKCQLKIGYLFEN